MTVRKDGWESGGLVIPTGDQWTDALYLASNGVIEPLAGYLEGVAAGRVPALTPEQLGYLAGIVRVLHMRGQKRPRGKPRGTWGRWGDPNYVAAWVAEPRIAIWKHDNGQPNIPETVRDKIIGDTVAEIRKWHFARRKPPSVDRVKAILAGPRSRRLPFMVIVPG